MQSMFKKQKGSILVFSLILFSMMLLIAVSFSAISIRERKTAATTDNSIQAFQFADTGSEKFMTELKSLSTVGEISTTVTSGFNCTGGELTDPLNPSYKISMYDSLNAQVSCDPSSTALLSTIKRIKVVGTHKDTARAVDLSVNNGVSNWLTDPACVVGGGPGNQLWVASADLAVKYQWKVTADWCNVNPNVFIPASQCVLQSALTGNYFTSPQTQPSVDFSAYPGQNACKAVGGRIPSLNELTCIFNHKANYGGVFINDLYMSSEEEDETSSRAFNMSSGTWSGDSKTGTYYVRCVKGD